MKAVVRKTFVRLNEYSRRKNLKSTIKEEKYKINYLTSHLRKLKKESHTISRVSRSK
jgi:hypothetical protein